MDGNIFDGTTLLLILLITNLPKELLKMTAPTETECTLIKTVLSTQASGRRICSMGKALRRGPMGRSSRGFISSGRRRDRVRVGGLDW